MKDGLSKQNYIHVTQFVHIRSYFNFTYKQTVSRQVLPLILFLVYVTISCACGRSLDPNTSNG